MRNIIHSITFILVLNITGFTQEVNSCLQEIDCKDFNLYIETKDVLIIDVRSNKAYQKERIPGAYLAYDKSELNKLLKNLDTNINVMVYCTRGIRSKNACEYICENYEFTNVFSLENGFLEWKRKNYPVDKKYKD